MTRIFQSAMPSIDAQNWLTIVKTPELSDIVAVRQALEAMAEFEVLLPFDLDEEGRRQKVLEIEAVICVIAMRSADPGQRWRELVDQHFGKFVNVCHMML